MHSTLLFLLLFLTSTDSVWAVFGGQEQSWDRVPFVVQLTSWLSSNSQEAYQCYGAMITPTLILTAPECVIEDKRPLSEIEILHRRRLSEAPHHRYGNYKTNKHLGIVVNWTDTWALVRFRGVEAESMCPSSSSPKGVTQLNLRLSLRDRSIISVDRQSILDSTCFVYGFDCVNRIDQNFNAVIRKVEINSLKSAPYGLIRLVQTPQFVSSLSKADIGVPLICPNKKLGMIQVGFLRYAITKEEWQKVNHLSKKLTTSKREAENEKEDIDAATKETKKAKRQINSNQKCEIANRFYFQVISDNEKLFEAIEKLDFSGLAYVYHKCNFNFLSPDVE